VNEDSGVGNVSEVDGQGRPTVPTLQATPKVNLFIALIRDDRSGLTKPGEMPAWGTPDSRPALRRPSLRFVILVVALTLCLVKACTDSFKNKRTDPNPKVAITGSDSGPRCRRQSTPVSA